MCVSGRTGKRTRDLHLYKNFKMAVKRGNDREAGELAAQLHSTAVRLQLLTFLSSCPFTYSNELLRKILALFFPVYLGTALEEGEAIL